MPPHHSGSHNNKRDRSPVLSDDSDTARNRSKKTNRRKEVAALLADQGKHASTEEMQQLRSYVRNVFDQGGDTPNGTHMRHTGSGRGRRVTSMLPDMFGVVTHRAAHAQRRDADTKVHPKHGGASDAHDVNGEEGETRYLVEPEFISVLDAPFHAVRWRLVRFTDVAESASLHWCRSESNVAVDALPLPSTSCADVEARSSSFETRESRAARRKCEVMQAWHAQRAEADRTSRERLFQLLREQRGLGDHRSDAVLLRSDEEFYSMLGFLCRTFERVWQREGHHGAASLPLYETCGNRILKNMEGCGFQLMQDLLTAFADCRTTVVACDRWCIHMQERQAAEPSSPLCPPPPAAAQSLVHMNDVVSIKEMLLFAIYGIMGLRITQMEEALRTGKTTAPDQRSVLHRLLWTHPFSPYRLLEGDEKNARWEEAGGVSELAVGQQRMERAFSRLLIMFETERARVKQRTAAVHAEASVNVPLQRQQTKFSTMHRTLTSFRDKVDTLKAEMETLGDELRVQMEVSRRLGDLVRCGLIMDERNVSMPTSFLMESVLWTLPASMATVQHREIEEALEKFLWGQPYALMSDDLVSAEYVNSIRCQLLVNLALRRAVTRKVTILASLRKLEIDIRSVVEAETEEGVALPQV
jgi:hypothetical protein